MHLETCIKTNAMLPSGRSSWISISVLDPGDFCRLWPSLHANESGWSLSGFHRPPGTEAELARFLAYTRLPHQQHCYRQGLTWKHDSKLSYIRNQSDYPVQSFLFREGEDTIQLPQEAVPDMKDLSPVLFEDSPSSSPCSLVPEGVCAAGGACEVFGKSVEEAVREMRFRIEQKTTLTASAGERNATSATYIHSYF